MKKSFLTVLILISLMTIKPIFAQLDSTQWHQIGLSLGSFRNSIIYPVMTIHYRSPIVFKHFRSEVEFTSYGNAFLFNFKNYDLDLQLQYTKQIHKNWLWYGGYQGQLRLRFNNDVRSNTTHSFESGIITGVQAGFGKKMLELPVGLLFYSNGLALQIQPEIHFFIHPKWSISARAKISYLTFYTINSPEWRYDTLLGIHYFVNRKK